MPCLQFKEPKPFRQALKSDPTAITEPELV
jgi:hypothetical protein